MLVKVLKRPSPQRLLLVNLGMGATDQTIQIVSDPLIGKITLGQG